MWTVIKIAANDWLRHHDPRLGAALAYYSVFSLGPLLLIVVSIAGLFFGQEAVSTGADGPVQDAVGSYRQPGGRSHAEGSKLPTSGKLAGIMSIILLLVAALGVVVQLKDALNTIWETKEPEGRGPFLRRASSHWGFFLPCLWW